MNTLPLVVSALLVCASISTRAEVTICKFSEASVLAKTISWDTETKKAKLQLSFGTPVDGSLLLLRPHQPFGTKVNIRFDTPKEVLGDELEFVVFPLSKAEFKAIAVAYKVIDGVKVLHATLANGEVSCNTL